MSELIAMVDKVETSPGKNGKKLIFVFIEGKKYLVFDKKWEGLDGTLVEYTKTQNGQYTNLELIRIIGKKDTQEELKLSETEIVYDKTKDEPIERNGKFSLMPIIERAALAFIQAGKIQDIDDYMTFIDVLGDRMETFLEEKLLVKTKEKTVNEDTE